ncbi:protein MpUGT20 [Marchantia polymorpha subsp. ruderalis]|uniref:Glycosyltransferase n=2 Tax=Marchantia polymorpha TaxID=3197 RepID=A0AAF6BAQ0_MARPO|nr:hypothetical protein MARPO_0148s0020 [Marchantia polymorpha]BBN09084.1 hypothetical protein Mp_4g17000 [Marchantia polymorpha subsp. ruderalis]|eukprot:PTQ29070.1 hypothetical protein MARPO_0148s0020 [Marchantia polymorpha]
MEQLVIQQETPICNGHTGASSTPAPRVWLVALPFISHVMSMTNLARQLASGGISVSLFVSEDDLRRLKTARKNLMENWVLQGLDIQPRILDAGPSSLAAGAGGSERFVTLFHRFEEAFKETLKKEAQTDSRPTCVIADFWMPGAREAAIKHDVPAWTFSPFSAAYLATWVYIRHLESNGMFKLPETFKDKRCEQAFISLPGFPIMRLHDLGEPLFKDDPLYSYSIRNASTMEQCDVVLLSGFLELEPRQTQELNRILKAYALINGRKAPEVYHVGPIFPFPSRKNGLEAVKSGAADEVHPSITFLDSQPASSVIFLAFGSDVNHTVQQIQEIAYGLENSQQPFICVLHLPKRESGVRADDIFSVIPEDCLARTKGRGLFVQSFAPQMEVLSHPSTGAFISHCGQNSVLEALASGVPILAWPCLYDQSMNCRFLVEEAQIALEICPGLLQGGGYVDRKQIEASIHTLFHTKEGSALRRRVSEMKLKAEAAKGPNGSSTKNLHAVCAKLKDLAKAHLENCSALIS